MPLSGAPPRGQASAGHGRNGVQAFSGARKVAIAHVIWEQTVVSQNWLAERLWMKSAANVSQKILRSIPLAYDEDHWCRLGSAELSLTDRSFYESRRFAFGPRVIGNE